MKSKIKKKAVKKPMFTAKDRKEIQRRYSKYIAEEISTGKYPRKQAIAIGISRANQDLKKKRGTKKVKR